MKTPYLIQRAKFQNRDKAGIDGLLRFDYMGSSEFEFGALGQSLGRIRNNIELYEKFDYSFSNGKTITLFCKKEDFIGELPDFLENIAKNNYHLLEHCDLNYYINGQLNYNDFWWDIENDYMFWKKNDDFTANFIKAICQK